jgi:hypothetical protein
MKIVGNDYRKGICAKLTSLMKEMGYELSLLGLTSGDLKQTEGGKDSFWSTW